MTACTALRQVASFDSRSAAGMAGFIKATLAVHTQTLPPTTGCERPHPELTASSAALRILREPQPWNPGRPIARRRHDHEFGVGHQRP